MTKVLVVDDDPSLLKALRIGLDRRGDERAGRARREQKPIDQVALAGPDLVILDLGLPDIDGLEVCRRIREFSERTDRRAVGLRRRAPQGRGARQRGRRLRHEAVRHGRARGAAPGGPAARRRPQGRRADAHRRSRSATSTSTWCTTWRPWRVDRCSSRPSEFELLAYLARHAGKVCTHHMILKDVWGPGYGAESNYVRVYTHRLRKKMGDEDGQLAEDGAGHRLPAGRRRSFRRWRTRERVEHHEHAALERRRALCDQSDAPALSPGTEARPRKRRNTLPVPSIKTASVRTHGRSKEATGLDLPGHPSRCRGATAATAVGLTSSAWPGPR